MLLRRRKPKAGESLLGYLLALTELNEYDSMSWIYQMIGWRNSKVFSYGIGAEELSALAAVDKSLLQNLYYKRAPVAVGERGGLMKSYFNGQRLSTHMIQQRRPKVCPMCLNDDDYLRSVWELAAVTSCPLHKTLLLQTCPACNNRISWNRNNICICKCGFDWRECEAGPLQDSEVIISRHIHWLCGVLPRGGFRVDAEPIYSVSLDGFLTALLLIAAQPGASFGSMTPVSKGSDITGKTIAPNLNNHELHVLLNTAFKVFQNWPDRYFDFLEWTREYGKKSRYRRGLGHDFGEFYATLFNRIPTGCVDFMRAAFLQYATPRPKRIGSELRLTDRELINKGYLPKRLVRERLKIDVNFMKSLIKEGKLKRIIYTEGRQRYEVIEATSVREVEREVGGWLGKSAACSMLGVGQKALMSLVESQLLVPARAGSRNSWLFTETSIIDLLRRLGSCVKPLYATGDIADLDEAFERAAREGCRFAQFINAILRREIFPVAINLNLGLKGLKFSSAAVKSFVDATRRIRKGDTIYLSDAAKLLDITPKVAFFLKDKGILRAQKAPTSLRPGFVVSRDEIKRFKTTYVQSSEIARGYNTHHSVIRHLLISAGVRPICGPAIDGKGSYFFRRSDVRAANLTKLLAEARAKGRLGTLRPLKSSAIAAVHLRVANPSPMYAKKQTSPDSQQAVTQLQLFSLMPPEVALNARC